MQITVNNHISSNFSHDNLFNATINVAVVLSDAGMEIHCMEELIAASLFYNLSQDSMIMHISLAIVHVGSFFDTYSAHFQKSSVKGLVHLMYPLRGALWLFDMVGNTAKSRLLACGIWGVCCSHFHPVHYRVSCLE
jgi:hypothetical protein